MIGRHGRSQASRFPRSGARSGVRRHRLSTGTVGWHWVGVPVKLPPEGLQRGRDAPEGSSRQPPLP
ncbi:hypothetical protein BIWAKO_00865 [Bosea sp. BIWAKO-01]|nr:hypothetical protein BIWAKO_00865 [Bosea sp. BIWAKO-01]